jgi:hypothetical protein
MRRCVFVLQPVGTFEHDAGVFDIDDAVGYDVQR